MFAKIPITVMRNEIYLDLEKLSDVNKIGKSVWKVPILGYGRMGKYPDWMRSLGRWDMAFRKGVLKLPLSLLFYVMGIKQE